MRRSRVPRIAVLVSTFVVTLAIRVWGVAEHFLLLGDQIRDWGIALGPLTELPLVGPPTHVHGYTIGPAFYWILWAIRVTVGPWYNNLPHAGGIGQAVLQSAADTLLLAAVWKRTQSMWIALTTITLVATASFDLALSALVWNPVMGSTLAKAATALVLLEWHRQSMVRVLLTAAAAWSAVHAYTGAVFVTVGVFAAVVVDPFVRGERATVRRNLLAIFAVVAVLQLPYLIHQLGNRFRDSALAAVTGGLASVLSGTAPPQLAKSVAGYAGALETIQMAPWHPRFAPWVLLACAVIVLVRYRRDTVVLTTTLVPQVAAIIGYALFLGGLDAYYYLSLMPAAALTSVLAVGALPPARFVPFVGAAMLASVFALLPIRIRHASTFFKMPEYKAIVDGSRRIVSTHQPMRAIRTAFTLPPTGDPEFVYMILGGHVDRQSPWVAVITSEGAVRYQRLADDSISPKR